LLADIREKNRPDFREMWRQNDEAGKAREAALSEGESGGEPLAYNEAIGALQGLTLTLALALTLMGRRLWPSRG
jgi:hypothetical protein